MLSGSLQSVMPDVIGHPSAGPRVLAPTPSARISAHFRPEGAPTDTFSPHSVEMAPLRRKRYEKLDLKNRPLDAFPNPSLPAALAAGPLPLTLRGRRRFFAPLSDSTSHNQGHKQTTLPCTSDCTRQKTAPGSPGATIKYTVS